MGNSCGKSDSVVISKGDPEPNPSIRPKLDGIADDRNNNAVVQCDPPEQCIAYVSKALDEQKFTSIVVSDYSETLVDLPGEELVFNFSGGTGIITEINSPAADAVDGPVIEASASAALTTSPSAISIAEDTGADSDQDDELEINTRETAWSRTRKNALDYKPPNDKYTTVFEDTMDLRHTEKREIIALSDLHLGGSWSKGMDGKLEKYLEGVIERATEKVACLVLLGDIFEMWLEKFTEVPPTNSQRVETWRSSLTVLTKAINKLVTECAVKIFYVRGNHDHEITAQDVAVLFDNKVTFVPCTLILRLQTADGTEHRARFAHGHEWDIFNSYMLHQVGYLLPDKPIGYYIARAVATAGRGDSDSELEDILIGFASTLLTMIPSSLEDDLVDSLVDPERHRKLISRLFESAFMVEEIDFLINAKCKVSEEKWIRLQTLLNYPLMQLCGDMVGKQDVFHMIKASTGDYKKFIKRSQEDVVVLAHTHRWDLRRYKNHSGNSVIYANTGCWTSNCEEFSTVVLSPPTETEDGIIKVDYGKNEQEEG